MEVYLGGWRVIWVRVRVMCIEMASRMGHPITFPRIEVRLTGR